MPIICATAKPTATTSKTSKLLNLLGPETVLLPCIGKRPVVSGWQNLNAKTMQNAKHLKQVEKMTNVGVLLGNASGGLCVIDFDADGEDQKFLAFNPSLQKTLRTRGRRGSSLWVRISGEIPRPAKLTCKGEDIGEWRADGNQSIISGLHPETGKAYRMLNSAKPVEIPFAKIVWADYAPFSRSSNDCDDSSEQAHNDYMPALICDAPFTEKELVRKYACKNSHTSHRRLFNLARGVKTLERRSGGDFSEDDFQRVFSKWYKISQPYLRRGSREKYFEEFLTAYDCAERGLDENILTMAWQKAQTAPLPQAASKFKSATMKKLIALCFQLQALVGEAPFHLACRSAAELLKVSATQGARLLNTLTRRKVLSVVERGGAKTNRASRYRFAASHFPPTPKPEPEVREILS